MVAIGATAFEGTYAKIVIGTGTTEIGDKAFISNATSGDIYLNLATPPDTRDNIIVTKTNWTPAESRWTLYVPKGCKSAYSNKSPWNKFKSIVEDGDLEKGEGEGGGESGEEEDNNQGTEDDGSYSDKLQDEKDESNPLRGVVANGFAGGTGTSSDPYRISNAAELRYFSDAVRKGEIFKNKYVVLSADITINENVLTSDGELNGDGRNFEPWIPVGRYDPSYFFCGTFDGKGHVISGLYCNRPNGDNVGFFGRLWGNVKNLTIKDSYFKGKNYVGGIIGDTRTSYISNTIPSSVMEYYRTSKTLTISACSNYSIVYGDQYVGGVVGRIFSNTEIKECLNCGRIMGGAGVGGIVGYSLALADNIIVSCCNKSPVSSLSTASISGSIGGIVGTGGCDVHNSLNTGDISNSYMCAGGIVGESLKLSEVSNCLNISVNIEASHDIGAIVGRNNGGKVSKNYFLFHSGLSDCGRTMNSGSTFYNSSMTESELSSSEFISKLNNAARGKWCSWKEGDSGYPVLKWMD
ncbi:MAG: hypothetical protein ACI3ZP_05580 [Candidatus Cryptobacteroides sp.]